jgi:small-conductance mechanosensitive channel
MDDLLQIWGVHAFFSGLPRAAMTRLESPVFLIQCGLIAVCGLIAFMLGRALVKALTRASLATVPQHWKPSLVRACDSLGPPLLWLFLLWLQLIGAEMASVRAPVIAAAAELTAAWVFIRLLSLSVKSHFVSMVVSVLVWILAALSILDFIDPVVRHLEASAIHIGKYRLSALTVVNAIIALSLLLWLTTLLFGTLKRQIARSTSLTPSLQVLLTQLLQIILPALAVVIALSAAGVNLTALTVISGAIFLGIGLGLQRLVANLVAGLTLLIGKSVKPGDIIAYKESFGQVTEMGARYVTLRKLDGSEHLVPNDFFLESGVENWSHSDTKITREITVGITYDSDLRLAVRLAAEAAASVPRVLKAPPPSCLVRDLGDSAVELAIFVTIDDPFNGTMNVKSDVLLAVWDAFHAHGIQFPFPQRDVRIVSLPEGFNPSSRR